LKIPVLRVSLPVAAAAVFYRIPLLLHESDAVMGLANRIMAGWASVITVGYTEARRNIRFYRDKTFVTGIPVRRTPVRTDRQAVIQQLGLPADVPFLLVMGGSQGAKQINDAVISILPSLLPTLSVIHLTGAEHVAAVTSAAAEIIKKSPGPGRYRALGYLPEIMPIMAAADVIITRAGANSLAEIASLSKAIIVIPLDGAAQDHQRQNAAIFEAADAARVIDPVNLKRSLLLQSIRDVFDRSELRATLEKNIGLLDRPQSAREIAKIAFKLAEGQVPRQDADKR
jgi:UDP-N-acetylglucosamine--N-acetylmuramyl-(pentapeptide) pyrophosphoryl-undecaprenol N-acetylglucosamine transferase